MTFASLSIVAGMLGLVYVNYFYQTYTIGAFTAYPEPVAVKMRRALYYTNIDFQAKQALKYYKQGLLVAAEVGMDPFSDEVLGIRIQVSQVMEEAGAW